MPRKKIETRVKEVHTKLKHMSFKQHLKISEMRQALKEEEKSYLAMEQTLLVLETLHPEVKEDE